MLLHEQGNCRMTFEAPPEPFSKATNETFKQLTPHEPLKTIVFV